MKKRADLPLPSDLRRRMSETEQNPLYHKEGDVLRHTELVVEQFYERASQFDLSEDDKQILFYTAALHDTGKTVTTRFEFGRWRSPGHELAGVPIARDILLREPSVSATNRRRILELIRWHGLPLRWAREQSDLHLVKRLGTQVDLRLLSIFAIMDLMGRECLDQDELLAHMEAIQSVVAPRAEYELGRYAELKARYRAFGPRFKDAAWKALRQDDIGLLEKLMHQEHPESGAAAGRRKLFLTIGPPLAGKSDWLTRHMPNAKILDMNEFNLREEHLGSEFYLERKTVEFRHSLQVFMRHHPEIVIEGRNTNAKLREALRESLRDMDIELHYLVFEQDLPTLLARNAVRDIPLDETFIRDRYNEFATLHPWEAHGMEWIVN